MLLNLVTSSVWNTRTKKGVLGMKILVGVLPGMVISSV